MKRDTPASAAAAMRGFWRGIAGVERVEIRTLMECARRVDVKPGISEYEIKAVRRLGWAGNGDGEVVVVGVKGREGVVEEEEREGGWRERINTVWPAERRAVTRVGPRFPVAPARAMVVGGMVSISVSLFLGLGWWGKGCADEVVVLRGLRSWEELCEGDGEKSR